ncbi:MAG: hypothetical protein H0V39_06090 [Nitrosomonas sp.]|nr:hypothetical protein [Nitrosomonas sp.]
MKVACDHEAVLGHQIQQSPANSLYPNRSLPEIQRQYYFYNQLLGCRSAGIILRVILFV